jgi:hypothetical protein
MKLPIGIYAEFLRAAEQHRSTSLCKTLASNIAIKDCGERCHASYDFIITLNATLGEPIRAEKNN